MTQPRFVPEYEELSRIDFLLDQLARAVERGEVPRASYDLMSPRYLARREDLVAILTGVNRVSAQPAAGAVLPLPNPGAATPPTDTRVAAVRRASKTVPWTTVLTFLGAFLVVVASAIFAVVVWDAVGVGAKLAMMGFLTALFYTGGWYALRLNLQAGGTALTAVGSAMLLFEGWIAIDGLNLEGPLPWATLLLICSAVYWYSEVRLARRFFGVFGAAAQAGWWWLLGAGLGWPTPLRLAGLAIVALAWQIASERGRDDRTVGPLARVLEWVAPVTAILLSAGVLLDLALLRNATINELAYAGVVALACGLIFWRSRLFAPTFNRQISAISQLPVFAAAAAVSATAGPGWWLVAALALMAVSYDAIALLRAGTSFAVIGLIAEVGLVVEACRVLDASDPVTLLVLVALAATWALGSRLSSHQDSEDRFRGLSDVALVAELGSFILMTIVSVLALAIGDGVALVNASLSSTDTFLALGVLTGWYALSGISRSAVAPFAGSLWALYTLAAFMSWLLPDQRPETYATGLVALAGLWVASARPFEQRFGELWGVATRWAGRLAVSLCVIAGIALGFELGNHGTPWPAVLMTVTAAVFSLDARVLRSRVTTVAATVSGVLAAAYLGGYLGYRAGSAFEAAWFSTSGAIGGALIAWGVVWLRGNSGALARYGSVAAALAPTPLLLAALEHPDHLAVGFACLAVAWAGAAVVCAQWLALPAGTAAVFSAVSVLAHLDGAAWMTTLALSAMGLLLGALAFTWYGGPEGRFAKVSGGLALSGIAAHGILVALGLAGESSTRIAAWNATGELGIAVAFMVLGAHIIAQAARWEFEPGHYVGGFALVCATWTLLGAFDATWLELYTTPLALYLVGAGYVRRHLSPAHRFPVLTDVGAVIVGLGYPLMAALSAGPNETLGHAGWILGLSLIAIGAGIAAKSRWYFFGGVTALTVVSLYRSFIALAEVWWLLLGLVGVAMLVIALTWERQRMLVASTRDRLRKSFEEWR